jgi:AraC-like DNA-binding protein
MLRDMNRDETQGPTSAECMSFWRADGPGGTEFLRGRYRKLRFAPHAHDRYLFGLITDGALEISDPGRSAIAAAGQVILYNHDQVHWGQSAARDGWSIHSIYVPPQDLDRTAREMGAPAGGTIGFRKIVAEDRILAQGIASLCAAGSLDHGALAKESLLSAVLAEALTRHADRYVRRPAVGRESRATRLAREFIDDNYARNLSLGELSEVSGIGRYWLIKAFKTAYGIPPYVYLTNVRVRHALRLLRDGMGIAEAALTCGFADQSHLSRMFKRSTGVTPGRFKGQRPSG